MKRVFAALLLPALLLSSAPVRAQSAPPRPEELQTIELREQLHRMTGGRFPLAFFVPST